MEASATPVPAELPALAGGKAAVVQPEAQAEEVEKPAEPAEAPAEAPVEAAADAAEVPAKPTQEASEEVAKTKPAEEAAEVQPEAQAEEVQKPAEPPLEVLAEAPAEAAAGAVAEGSQASAEQAAAAPEAKATEEALAAQIRRLESEKAELLQQAKAAEEALAAQVSRLESEKAELKQQALEDPLAAALANLAQAEQAVSSAILEQGRTVVDKAIITTAASTDSMNDWEEQDESVAGVYLELDAGPSMETATMPMESDAGTLVSDCAVEQVHLPEPSTHLLERATLTMVSEGGGSSEVPDLDQQAHLADPSICPEQASQTMVSESGAEEIEQQRQRIQKQVEQLDKEVLRHVPSPSEVSLEESLAVAAGPTSAGLFSAGVLQERRGEASVVYLVDDCESLAPMPAAAEQAAPLTAEPADGVAPPVPVVVPVPDGSAPLLKSVRPTVAREAWVVEASPQHTAADEEVAQMRRELAALKAAVSPEGKTVGELSLADIGKRVRDRNERFRRENEELRQENERLRALLTTGGQS